MVAGVTGTAGGVVSLKSFADARLSLAGKST